MLSRGKCDRLGKTVKGTIVREVVYMQHVRFAQEGGGLHYIGANAEKAITVVGAELDIAGSGSDWFWHRAQRLGRAFFRRKQQKTPLVSLAVIRHLEPVEVIVVRFH